MALVAIVGRPNVGKSTLFNRFIEDRTSIVHDEPGVTRDRIYGRLTWNGRTVDLVDTGGYTTQDDDQFTAATREQVRIAIDETDAILFVVDARSGINPLDEDVSSLLRRTDKPVFIVANKSDNDAYRLASTEHYGLGLGTVYPISALNGSGTGELLDDLMAALPPGGDEDDPDTTRLAIIGRPNVGKSSLTNALLGEDRTIVSNISGTTRDAIDSPLTYFGRKVVLVDTAGLRRRAKVTENVEFYAQLRTQRAIESCDVALLMIDAKDGLEAQDIRILIDAAEQKKGLVIVVNKWDTVEKDTHSTKAAIKAIRDRIPTLGFAPILFISAKTRQRIGNVLKVALQVADNRELKVPTRQLNEFLKEAVTKQAPPRHRHVPVKLNYITQVNVAPPVFAIFCNYPEAIKESYRRFLDNQLRMRFNFEGVPVTFRFRSKHKSKAS